MESGTVLNTKQQLGSCTYIYFGTTIGSYQVAQLSPNKSGDTYL